MNCKPGDLAFIVGKSPFAGRLVEVLYAAPPFDFELPDGHANCGCPPNCWVLRILGSPFEIQVENTHTRLAMYGAGSDTYLRPLRGDAEKTDAENDLEITL